MHSQETQISDTFKFKTVDLILNVAFTCVFKLNLNLKVLIYIWMFVPRTYQHFFFKSSRRASRSISKPRTRSLRTCISIAFDSSADTDIEPQLGIRGICCGVEDCRDTSSGLATCVSASIGATTGLASWSCNSRGGFLTFKGCAGGKGFCGSRVCHFHVFACSTVAEIAWNGLLNEKVQTCQQCKQTCPSFRCSTAWGTPQASKWSACAC